MVLDLPVRVPVSLAAAIIGVSATAAFGMIAKGVLPAAKIRGARGMSVGVADLGRLLERAIAPIDLTRAMARAEAKQELARRHRNHSTERRVGRAPALGAGIERPNRD